MIRRHITAFRLALMTSDALTSMVLFVLISHLRWGAGWQQVWRGVAGDPWIVAAVVALAWVTSLWLHDLYRLRARWSLRSDIRDTSRAVLLVAVASFSILFLFRFPDVSRLFLLALFAAQLVVTMVSRISIRFVAGRLRDHGYLTRYMLIVGTGAAAVRFGHRIERHRELGLRVIGYLRTDDEEISFAGRARIVGDIQEIASILHSEVVDEVAICLEPDDGGLLEPLARLCEDEGKVVRVPLRDDGMILPGGRVEEFDGIQVLSLVYGPDRVLALVGKRLVDVALAGIGLVVLAPIFLAIALWIRVSDGAPVLFRQTRTGLHGRAFRIIKFRTMTSDAEARLAGLIALNEITGPAFKLTHDPRMTRPGRILRATSLDELPQLWNVLLGEMSIVGPRPPLPHEVEGYDVWHRRRLAMKPGITGLWQVQARREAEFDQWVALDLSYIDRWSLWLDLKIIFRTIPALLQGR